MRFSEIPGQVEIKTKLIQAVQSGRIPHAQLFLGPEGCGNLALAIAYAQFINCKSKIYFQSENEIPADSCGLCPSCLKFEKYAHPDLHFIFPNNTNKQINKNNSSTNFQNEWREILRETQTYFSASQWYEKINLENKQGIINARDCEEIIRILSLKSYEAEFKIMIIWKVEKLFYAAAPKILKILEEPTDKTIFLLVSEDQDQILNTILSRSQLVKVPKLKDYVVVEYLKNRYSADGNQIQKVVNLANGNLVEAIRIYEQNEDETFNFITFRQWMRHCYSAKISEIDQFISKTTPIGREKLKGLTVYGLKTIRNILLYHYGQETLKIDNEELDFIQKFSPFISIGKIDWFSCELESAYQQLERNANPSVLMMDISIKFSRWLKMTA